MACPRPWPVQDFWRNPLQPYLRLLRRNAGEFPAVPSSSIGGSVENARAELGGASRRRDWR